MAAIAGARRYYRNVSLIYMDRDADLNVPATTPSGCIDGMVISQVIGRGAPELVRFWGEPPLVREPDIALFGYERLDAPEEQYWLPSPLRRHASLEVSALGGDAAAHLALERVHAAKHEFVLHFDVDTINGDEFPWTNFPGAGGLTWNEVRDALRVFVSQTNLAALVVAGYNPDLDADGTGAQEADRFAGGRFCHAPAIRCSGGNGNRTSRVRSLGSKLGHFRIRACRPPGHSRVHRRIRSGRSRRFAGHDGSGCECFLNVVLLNANRFFCGLGYSFG